VAQRLGDQPARTQGVVVACSALKRSYRDLLRAAAPAMRLVYLDGDAALIAQRLASRQGHYMPPSLLQSQLDTLQPPEADEYPLVLDIAQPPEALVARAAQALRETVA
jgi:gluconokinase